MKPQGRLQLTIHSTGGALLAERRASNRVLRRGAELIASLFTGARTTGGIDTARFGFGTTPLPLDAVKLSKDGPVATLKPADFKVETGSDAVLVSVQLSFTPKADVKGVSEAALFAGPDPYNHVLFEPVDMKTGQVITFFWEITFPFGN
jgi:hypothetical protein